MPKSRRKSNTAESHFAGVERIDAEPETIAARILKKVDLPITKGRRQIVTDTGDKTKSEKCWTNRRKKKAKPGAKNKRRKEATNDDHPLCKKKGATTRKRLAHSLMSALSSLSP